jgi:hypothetical protein
MNINIQIRIMYCLVSVSSVECQYYVNIWLNPLIRYSQWFYIVHSKDLCPR